MIYILLSTTQLLIIALSSGYTIQTASINLVESNKASARFIHWFNKIRVHQSLNQSVNFDHGTIESKLFKLYILSAGAQSFLTLRDSVISKRLLNSKVKGIITQVSFSEKVIRWFPYVFFAVMTLLGMIKFTGSVLFCLVLALGLQAVGYLVSKRIMMKVTQ